MSLSINCRSTGPIPAIWSHGPETGTVVSSDEQLLGDAWGLKLRTLMLRSHMVGYDADRLFPTISISAIIQRKSHYFVYNAMVPFALFSFLSVMQFSLRLKLRESSVAGASDEDDGGGGADPVPILLGHINHRSQMSLMLVFTCATYKMAVGGRMPVVAYLTFLDKFMLLNSFFVVLVSVQSRACSSVVDLFGAEFVNPFEFYCSISFSAVWLVAQLKVVYSAYRLSTRARPREESLNGHPEFVSIWNASDQQRLLTAIGTGARKGAEKLVRRGRRASTTDQMQE